MDMQEMEITIDTEGKVEVKVKGMHGQECVKTTENIENALGDVQKRHFCQNITNRRLPKRTQEMINQK
jgi:hypothetical protein